MPGICSEHRDRGAGVDLKKPTRVSEEGLHIHVFAHRNTCVIKTEFQFYGFHSQDRSPVT